MGAAVQCVGDDCPILLGKEISVIFGTEQIHFAAVQSLVHLIKGVIQLPAYGAAVVELVQYGVQKFGVGTGHFAVGTIVGFFPNT